MVSPRGGVGRRSWFAPPSPRFDMRPSSTMIRAGQPSRVLLLASWTTRSRPGFPFGRASVGEPCSADEDRPADGEVLLRQDVVHGVQGYAHAAVRGGLAGNARQAVDGDAAVEVPRPVERAERPRIPPVDGAVDVVGPLRGDCMVGAALALVVGTRARTGVEDPPDVAGMD